ncbi:hypothetical protein EWM64_g152 [Hericium alpestre]|uniref:Methyltransferase n=1 Tax=Hericium alpestre TaxID=135208 RepID=A0A4Z0AC10_9AGAM|nr:hypothetical protein EWM64_g152 [Hericium alpestre]
MATAAVLTSHPHDVPTTLNYYGNTGNERPFNYTYPREDGQPQSNIVAEPHEAVVHDIRGKEDTVGLDITGFQFVKHTSAEKLFEDEEAIKSRYYQEVEDILKKEAGAKRVFIFDHTIRRPVKDGDNDVKRGPVTRVHVDQTFEAGFARVRHHMGDEAERLLKSRVRIINVWRPIENPVAHHPLAVADYRSIQPDDLISTRHIYRDREGSTFSVKYNPNHKWYYLGNQTPDEVILIKCFDSDETKARLTPHTAFLDATSLKEAPERQSIEVRCLVFDSE